MLRPAGNPLSFGNNGRLNGYREPAHHRSIKEEVLRGLGGSHHMQLAPDLGHVEDLFLEHVVDFQNGGGFELVLRVLERVIDRDPFRVNAPLEGQQRFGIERDRVLTIPGPGTNRVRGGLQILALGEVGVGDNQLLDLLDVVAGHVLAVGKVVGFKIGGTGAKQMPHEPSIETGRLEVVSRSPAGGAL